MSTQDVKHKKKPELETRYLLKRLWRGELRFYKGRIALIFLLTALTSGLTALYPLVIQQALDMLNGRVPILIYKIPMWILLITGFKALFQYGQILALQSLVLKIVCAMQKKLFSVLTTADMAQVEKQAPAKNATHFTSDIFCVRDLLTKLVNALGNGITVIGLILSMIWMDWTLSLAALCLYPIAAFPIQRLGRYVRGSARFVQSQMGELSEGLCESFAQARTIRVYQMEAMEDRRASHLFSSLRQAMMRVVRMKSTIEPFLEVLGGCIIAGVLIFTQWRTQMGYATVGDLTGFVASLLLVAHPLRSLGNLHATLQEGFGGLERIYDVLDAPKYINDPQQCRDNCVRDDTVCFKDVSFTYPDGRKALKDVNFDVPHGRMVALIGGSGAGKSTVLSLIPRFYDVTSGEISLGGEDIRNLSLSFLRRQMAYVNQDTFLFNFTIKENIRVGRQDISDEDIIRAAQMADMDHFVSALPDGFDTVVGYQGQSLSGGQRQRVAIARALAGHSRILLLDEITSALDGHTEAAIQKTFQKLRGTHTIIIAAHRLSTVRQADEIIVFENGQVVERGHHKQLMAQNGVYARYIESQFSTVTN